ncbi:LamB/YcsF family protein [Macrococcus brunensis]|uniref:5-oxoprolinase subunit A n=1 Tax=Macrococcus brunensis TaxID=198483 RepID=A0A4R6BD71_9STAP|nr:5-oxoprolinase subunit PxpA [Macrococcus brunensis]TDL96813.1 LamB/YcsF family protein [Macrococcus brunensis]ULG71667.1 LamB/YcsF family protein [Macrococcus brunensis]ULG73929.1 LamB/YcsF family protein [Macrococcus brunensis]
MKIDLNADLGESFGNYKIGNDAAIIPLITSANVACGMHAGDFNVMEQTIQLCKEQGVGIGAHPGYNDLMGFGRRKVDMPYEEVEALITYQVGAIQAFCQRHGVKLNHVKPHGALYNATFNDRKLADHIVDALYRLDPALKVMGIAGGHLVQAAEDKGMTGIHEVFADRNYEEDGTLVSRKEADALIHDAEEATAHILRMINDQVVKTKTGKLVPIQADSICVHGDGPEALQFVHAIRTALQKQNIELTTI